MKCRILERIYVSLAKTLWFFDELEMGGADLERSRSMQAIVASGNAGVLPAASEVVRIRVHDTSGFGV